MNMSFVVFDEDEIADYVYPCTCWDDNNFTLLFSRTDSTLLIASDVCRKVANWFDATTNNSFVVVEAAVRDKREWF